VEDNEATAFLVQLALREIAEAVQYDRVCDVATALQRLLTIETLEEGLRPTLMLLDLNLPPRSGWEVLIMVQNTKALIHMRVVIFTTSDDHKDRSRAHALGAFGYICKPRTFAGYLLALQKVVAMMPE
jgi:DNA-binding NarL/FixJ family response regulator